MGYTQDLVAHWDLSTDNPPDICWRGNRYPGTGANIVGHPNGIAGGRCAEFNGNNSNINVGDVVELNAVEKFTIAFWMNQDMLDQSDYIFRKIADATHGIRIWTTSFGTGWIQCYIEDGIANAYGWFNYVLFMTAGAWYHLAVVFDGSQADNAGRLKIYLDGAPVALAFSGAIPAATPNLSGADATIGYSSESFDGKLDESMIFCSALTQIQVNDLMIRARQGRF